MKSVGIEEASKYRYPPGVQAFKYKSHPVESSQAIELLPQSESEPEPEPELQTNQNNSTA